MDADGNRQSVTQTSVLDKATAVVAEANRLREGAQAEDNAKRVLTQATELDVALARLANLAETGRALRERGAHIDLGRLDEGREAFARKTATGLPSPQLFPPAKAKVEEAAKQVTQALEQSWTLWTQTRITELPVQRLVMLDSGSQRSERESVNTLKALQRKRLPTIGDVAQFAVLHKGLLSELEQLPDPHPDLQDLLQRLGSRVPLDQISDTDIALLRRYHLDDQIELRRRGV
jgi:hypothetical protein